MMMRHSNSLSSFAVNSSSDGIADSSVLNWLTYLMWNAKSVASTSSIT